MNFVQVFIWTFEQMNMNKCFLFKCSFERLNKWTWTRSFLNVFGTNEHEHTFFERVQNKWTWTNFFWACSEQMNMNMLIFERVQNKWTWTRFFWTCSAPIPGSLQWNWRQLGDSGVCKAESWKKLHLGKFCSDVHLILLILAF